ncbi:MAG: DUF4435 domain-containing protein [Candidatus Marithrix sp.]
MNFEDNTTKAKYDFIVESELRHNLRYAGRKNIVFVEGDDDEMIYNTVYKKEDLYNIVFVDVSLAAKKTGGCKEVKDILIACVEKFPNEKRFYGVIDRDLKTDQEVKTEMEESCYDSRLFIFFERYTLENYFIEIEVLYEFLRGQSSRYKRLKPLLEKGKENFEKEVIASILTCLASIAAANLSIRNFNPSENFLELRDTIPCEEDVIRKAIVQKLEQPEISEEHVSSKFLEFKNNIIEKKEAQKFASAKKYLDHQFEYMLKKIVGTKVSINLNHHKSELARILKEQGLPKDFNDLLRLISQPN